MRIAYPLGMMLISLSLVGCAGSLEKGWKKESSGERVAAIRHFSRALIDSEETYRGLAAEELIRIGEPAVPALTAVLSRKGHYYDIYYGGARKEAAWALGEIGSEEAVFPLLAVLKTAGEVYKEEDFISEVKALSGRAGLAKMVKDVARYSDKNEEDIAGTMEKYLEEIGKVLRMALDDEDRVYREEELVSVRDSIALLQLRGEEGKKVKEKVLGIVESRLWAKMSSGPPELIVGIEALGKIRDRRAVEFLLEMLEETYTRPEAALALARIGERKAIPFLEEAWREEGQDSIKVNLEAALYLMGDESKWEPLVERLRDRRLRREAAELLGEIGDEKGVGPLVEALSDEREGVRGEAVKALKRIGGREAEEALLRALNDDAPGVRKEAILAVVNSEKSGEALRKIVADEGEELIIRLAAASRLGEWGDRSSLPLALKVAEDNRKGDLSCLSLIESLTDEEERRIVKAVFSKKSFWARAPHTYNEEMLIEAIDRIGRAQEREVRIGLRKLFRDRVDVYPKEARMRVIDREGIEKEKLRSLFQAAEEIRAARAKGEDISLKDLGEILEIDPERDEEAKRRLLSLRAALEKLEHQPVIKMLLKRLLDLKGTFADGEKIMAIAALGRMGEGKEILREIYRDREENYPIRFEARRALLMMGGKE